VKTNVLFGIFIDQIFNVVHRLKDVIRLDIYWRPW